MSQAWQASAVLRAACCVLQARTPDVQVCCARSGRDDACDGLPAMARPAGPSACAGVWRECLPLSHRGGCCACRPPLAGQDGVAVELLQLHGAQSCGIGALGRIPRRRNHTCMSRVPSAGWYASCPHPPGDLKIACVCDRRRKQQRSGIATERTQHETPKNHTKSTMNVCKP